MGGARGLVLGRGLCCVGVLVGGDGGVIGPAAELAEEELREGAGALALGTGGAELRGEGEGAEVGVEDGVFDGDGRGGGGGGPGVGRLAEAIWRP